MLNEYAITDKNTFFNAIISIITVLGSIVTSLIMGFIITAYMVYEKEEENVNDNNVFDEEEEAKEAKIKYYNQYFDELNNLENIDFTIEKLEILRLKTIKEETPEGKVIMTYNSDTESFWYYSDTKTISYKLLDTVARLFAITYNCKSICINYKEEIEKSKEKNRKQKELAEQKELEEQEKLDDDEQKDSEQEKLDKPKEKSIFVKFKNYNTGAITQNKTQPQKQNQKNSTTTSKKEYYIMAEKSNQFKYKGKIEDFNKYNCININNNDNDNNEGDAVVPNNDNNNKLNYALFKTKYKENIKNIEK